jgi:hypothetical protein
MQTSEGRIRALIFDLAGRAPYPDVILAVAISYGLIYFYKFSVYMVSPRSPAMYSVSTKSHRGFEKLWRANKLS